MTLQTKTNKIKW